MEDLIDIAKKPTTFLENLKKTVISAGYFTGIIIGILGFIILIYILLIHIKIQRINNWPVHKGAGKITDSYMETTNKILTYSLFFVSTSYYEVYYRTRVSFTYTINGQTYTSQKLSFIEPWNNNAIVARDEVDKYQPGTTVDIIVNPNNPAEAYIINQSYTNYSLFGIAILMVILGSYIFSKG